MSCCNGYSAEDMQRNAAYCILSILETVEKSNEINMLTYLLETVPIMPGSAEIDLPIIIDGYCNHQNDIIRESVANGIDKYLEKYYDHSKRWQTDWIHPHVNYLIKTAQYMLEKETCLRIKKALEKTVKDFPFENTDWDKQK